MLEWPVLVLLSELVWLYEFDVLDSETLCDEDEGLGEEEFDDFELLELDSPSLDEDKDSDELDVRLCELLGPDELDDDETLLLDEDEEEDELLELDEEDLLDP